MTDEDWKKRDEFRKERIQEQRENYNELAEANEELKNQIENLKTQLEISQLEKEVYYSTVAIYEEKYDDSKQRNIHYHKMKVAQEKITALKKQLA